VGVLLSTQPYAQRHSFLALCPPPCKAMISLGKFCSFSETLSLSVTTFTRFIRCSLNIKLVIFYSGHVFYKFSEILFLVLSSNQNNLSSFQFFFSAEEPHTLFLFSSAYPGCAFPSVHLFLVYLRVYSFMPFSSLGRGSRPVMFLMSEGNSGQSGSTVKNSFCGTSG
jgi:hypothetical protein